MYYLKNNSPITIPIAFLFTQIRILLYHDTNRYSLLLHRHIQQHAKHHH